MNAEGWMDGWMDGWMNGWMEGRVNGSAVHWHTGIHSRSVFVLEMEDLLDRGLLGRTPVSQVLGPGDLSCSTRSIKPDFSVVP